MIYKLIILLDKKLNFVTVSAKSESHNYDPLSMQLAVLTLMRNADLISEFKNKAFLTVHEQVQYNDLLNLKFDNYDKLKNEVVLLTRHFNEELPEDQLCIVDSVLNDIFIDNELNSHYFDKKLSRQLLTLVNKLVGMYWQSKGVNTIVAQCSSPLNYPLCIRC